LDSTITDGEPSICLPFLELNKIEVSTVDSFQGREKDIIIISCVRANGHSRGSTIGFVADVRRINVSITRARHSLWIIGDATVLQKNVHWDALITSAKERGLFRTPTAPFDYTSRNRCSFRSFHPTRPPSQNRPLVHISQPLPQPPHQKPPIIGSLELQQQPPKDQQEQLPVTKEPLQQQPLLQLSHFQTSQVHLSHPNAHNSQNSIKNQWITSEISGQFSRSTSSGRSTLSLSSSPIKPINRFYSSRLNLPLDPLGRGMPRW